MKLCEPYTLFKGVTCMALSISTKILITGSDNGIVRLWNTFISKPIAIFSEYQSPVVDIQIIESQNVFLSCSFDGIIKLWDLKEQLCLQTIKIKFPAFRIDGKLIEWGTNCIYPGPRRTLPDDSKTQENKKECFGINDICEMKSELDETRKRKPVNVWERSCILVTCCNHLAVLRANFTDASIEYAFTYLILPPPPLQNSVLIPTNWGLQSDVISQEKFERKLNFKVEKHLEELEHILDRNILEEDGTRSDINYKIAILESKKEKMRSKVALGSPYLALDLHDIPELKLSDNLPVQNQKRTGHYAQKITQLLENAAYKDDVFSSPEPSTSRSRSSKSSVMDIPY